MGHDAAGENGGTRSGRGWPLQAYQKTSYIGAMKATIEFDDRLYRRLKIEAARRGRTIRDLVQEGVRAILDEPPQPAPGAENAEPEWFGSLSAYASNAGEAHDMAAIRRSIAEGRQRPGA
jgi:hypothetical protein